MRAPAYTEGLHEVADGVFAYLQPDGGWGWSNAGLAVGDGSSLLVDTLFDLRLTQRMLDAMAPHVHSSPILLPIIKQIGVDPVHFGIIMIVNLGIGLLTPPVGSVLFVGSAVGKIPIEKVPSTRERRKAEEGSRFSGSTPRRTVRPHSPSSRS